MLLVGRWVTPISKAYRAEQARCSLSRPALGPRHPVGCANAEAHNSRAASPGNVKDTGFENHRPQPLALRIEKQFPDAVEPRKCLSNCAHCQRASPQEGPSRGISAGPSACRRCAAAGPRPASTPTAHPGRRPPRAWRRLTSRLSRSIGLLVLMHRQCSRGKAMCS